MFHDLDVIDPIFRYQIDYIKTKYSHYCMSLGS